MRGPILTGVTALGSTVVAWMLIVMAVDQHVPQGNFVWAGSLWSAAMICTACVSYSRWAVRPVLACTVAFGLFAYGYLLLEGPIFGEVSMGGDPRISNLVVWTLIPLPLGVFVVSEMASVLGTSDHDTSSTDD